MQVCVYEYNKYNVCGNRDAAGSSGPGVVGGCVLLDVGGGS